MKTLMIVTGGLGTGGLERISSFVANKFCEKGWKVVVLTLLQKETSKKSFQILNENVDKLHALARYLLEKETITGEEFLNKLKENSPSV